MVSSWLETCKRPSVWVSLDHNDDDLRQFLSYFVASIQALFPEAARETQSLLQTHHLPSPAVLAAILVNELEQIHEHFIVVLDDIHCIKNLAVYDFLNRMLKHPPPAMQLVLVGRRDPSLPVASLRANGLLTEVRMQDLRFSQDEGAALLQASLECAIDDAIVAALVEKSEGWVAGLYLAALAMRGQKDPGRKLVQIKGTTRYVVDYLVSEVLEGQPSEFRYLMLATSMLDRFCAPLCRALLAHDYADGEGDIGAEFFTKLQNENLFLIPLDTESIWFRYHHLFKELLQHQLHQHLNPEDITSLHSRASEWFEEQGLIEESLQHALKADEVERAVQIIQRYRQDAVNTDRWYLLEKWLSLMPENIVQEHAELLMAQTWVLLHNFRFEMVLKIADRIEELIADDTGRETMRGEVDLCRGL